MYQEDSPMPAKSPDSAESMPHFHYHACAHAFAAQFTRPFHEQIDVIAASALPPTGGHGHSVHENFRFRQFISFKRAYTHVSGGFQVEDKSNNTLVTSVIEGLNMMDILTADRIVCRLYSKHPKDAPEGHITMHGSKFENLSICGQPVNINLDFGLFEDIQTFEHAQAAFKSNDKFRRLALAPLQSGAVLSEQKCNGAFLCSLVENGSIQTHAPGVKGSGHSLYVPGFGTVFLAETVISHGTRSLTMLRFELGSTTSVGGSAAAATTNGKQWPPGS
jgi:hypothetical protein